MDALLLIFVAIYVVAATLSVWAGSLVRRFLRENSSIADVATLERFKALARQNMRFALLQIALLSTGIILGILLLFRHGLLALIPIVITNVLLTVLAKSLGPSEKAARSLPAATPDLLEQCQRVSQSWVSRALPDF
jgi:hypothetical protein